MKKKLNTKRILNVAKKFVLSFLTLLLIACEKPTSSITYIFIENANTPAPFEVPSATPTSELTVNLTIEPPKTPSPTPTPPLLEVFPNVNPTCDKKGQLLEVYVNLKVSGGIPPYLANDKEINPAMPIFSLRAGSYNEFDIKSSDGQIVHMSIWAPYSCDDANQEKVINPPPTIIITPPPPPTDIQPPSPPPTDVQPPPSTPCPTKNPSGKPDCP